MSKVKQKDKGDKQHEIQVCKRKEQARKKQKCRGKTKQLIQASVSTLGGRKHDVICKD